MTAIHSRQHFTQYAPSSATTGWRGRFVEKISDPLNLCILFTIIVLPAILTKIYRRLNDNGNKLEIKNRIKDALTTEETARSIFSGKYEKYKGDLEIVKLAINNKLIDFNHILTMDYINANEKLKLHFETDREALEWLWRHRMIAVNHPSTKHFATNDAGFALRAIERGSIDYTPKGYQKNKDVLITAYRKLGTFKSEDGETIEEYYREVIENLDMIESIFAGVQEIKEKEIEEYVCAVFTYRLSNIALFLGMLPKRNNLSKNTKNRILRRVGNAQKETLERYFASDATVLRYFAPWESSNSDQTAASAACFLQQSPFLTVNCKKQSELETQYKGEIDSLFKEELFNFRQDCNQHAESIVSELKSKSKKQDQMRATSLIKKQQLDLAETYKKQMASANSEDRKLKFTQNYQKKMKAIATRGKADLEKEYNRKKEIPWIKLDQNQLKLMEQEYQKQIKLIKQIESRKPLEERILTRISEKIPEWAKDQSFLALICLSLKKVILSIQEGYSSLELNLLEKVEEEVVRHFIGNKLPDFSSLQLDDRIVKHLFAHLLKIYVGLTQPALTAITSSDQLEKCFKEKIESATTYSEIQNICSLLEKLGSLPGGEAIRGIKESVLLDAGKKLKNLFKKKLEDLFKKKLEDLLSQNTSINLDYRRVLFSVCIEALYTSIDPGYRRDLFSVCIEALSRNYLLEVLLAPDEGSVDGKDFAECLHFFDVATKALVEDGTYLRKLFFPLFKERYGFFALATCSGWKAKIKRKAQLGYYKIFHPGRRDHLGDIEATYYDTTLQCVGKRLGLKPIRVFLVDAHKSE